VKKIVKILYPPVVHFVLRMNFKEIDNPTIKTLKDISDKLSETGYSEPTRIRLISSKGLDSEFSFVPLRFLSEEAGNEILIFRDSIYFQYNEKYPTWEKILPNILENFFFLSEKLGFSLIESISLDYIDLFDKFPQKGFKIDSYFNIHLKYPPELEMDYNDFIIGIKLNTEDPNHKSILRIRGLKPINDECYKIQLETHYSIKESINTSEKERLNKNLNISHINLLDNFKLVLSEKTKKIIVMENGGDSEKNI